MISAVRRWLDHASGLLHPAMTGELCIAIITPAADATRNPAWGHLPLSQVSVLHGVH